MSLDFEERSSVTALQLSKSIWAEGSTVAGAVPEGWLPIGDASSLFDTMFKGNDPRYLTCIVDRSMH